MSWRRFRKIVQRALFFPAQADRDLDDEIRFHLAEEARLQAERGLSPADAEAAAKRAFGNVPLAKETTRAVWVSTACEQFVQDLRFGCRILTRSPAISITAVVLIALVIGGNTTVFSIAHGVLTKPSSGVHASGLTTVSWVAENGDVETHASYRVYSHFLEHSTGLRPLAAFDFARLTLTHETGSYAVRTTIVSPNYFETLGVRLVKGRSFTAEEASRGTSGLVVVIAHHIWQNSFQGADNIIGQSLGVNGQPATIVGVAEPGFRGALFPENTDLWVPLSAEPRAWLQPNRSTVDVMMIGQRNAGASLSEAQSELATLWTQLQRAHPEFNQDVRIRLVSYSATAGGNSIVSMRGNRMLAIFSVVTFLTIVVVCANVANLLIARAMVQQREMAVRQSLGASRLRIVRSQLAEGLVLSLAAWMAACLFAWAVSKSVIRFLAPQTERPVLMPDLTPDWTVIGYALVLALVCTFAVTAGPAFRTRQQQLLPFLKVGEQGVVPGRSRLTHGLVVLQLALSILLLTSAGLAQRSLTLRDGIEAGFDTQKVLLATISTAGAATGPQGHAAAIEALRERTARLPGVAQVSFVAGIRLSSWLDTPLRRGQTEETVLAADNHVAPGFFATLGVPFLAGRDFPPTATHGGGRTAIVNRYLADTLWPGEPAVGKRLQMGRGDSPVEAEVIGVVEDAYFAGRGTESRPRFIFFSSLERPTPPGETTFYIRFNGGQDVIAPAVARAFREVDPRIPIASLRSLDSHVAEETAPFWILTTLLTLFAVGSLMIAAIGQYAVVAFDGRRRTREFGLRIALGASSAQLIAAVMAESFRLTMVGLVIGFGLSVATGSVLAGVLFGVTPTDPPTYLGVFALLATASLLACYLPARRAARTDPLVALRTE